MCISHDQVHFNNGLTSLNKPNANNLTKWHHTLTCVWGTEEPVCPKGVSQRLDDEILSNQPSVQCHNDSNKIHQNTWWNIKIPNLIITAFFSFRMSRNCLTIWKAIWCQKSSMHGPLPLHPGTLCYGSTRYVQCSALCILLRNITEAKAKLPTPICVLALNRLRFQGFIQSWSRCQHGTTPDDRYLPKQT